MMNNIPTDYQNLMQKVQSFFIANPTVEGVFSVLPENGDVELMEIFTNSKKRNTEEKKFVQRLIEQKKTKLVRSICVWKNGTFDVMSGSLLKLLMSIHPDNAQALHLMKTGRFHERSYFSLLGE